MLLHGPEGQDDRNEDGNTVLISPYFGKSPVGLDEEEDVFLWKEISRVEGTNTASFPIYSLILC